MQQLDLFGYEHLSVSEKQHVLKNIRSFYFHIRLCRKSKIHDARRRKYYRLIAIEKKRLMISGVPKSEILEFLSCCRLKCGRLKTCQFCKGEFRQIYARFEHLLPPANSPRNFA